jgi:putative endopeptidase
VHPFRFVVRTLGAVALTALVATSIAARADSPAKAFDVANLDPTCKACDDFDQFATGGWRKTHSIPPGKSRYGGFDVLADANRANLTAILEDAAKNASAPAGSDEQKLRDFYTSCMDENAIEAAGLTPVQPLLGQINAIHDVPSLLTTMAALQQAGVGTNVGLGARADLLDSTKQIATLNTGGLILGDRKYYVNNDDKYPYYRAEYGKYATAQLANLGDANAAADAGAVIALETAMAAVIPDRTELRDPHITYNPTPVAKLATIAPDVPWTAYFAAFRPPAFDTINVTLPKVAIAYDDLIKTTPLEVWKNNLRLHVIDAYAGDLPKKFDDARFAFRSGVLLGVTTRRPRSETCTTATDQSLRDVLGRVYVTRYFPAAAKARAQSLVDNLQATLADDIKTLDWMSPQTKVAAEAKLAAFTKKIGYPDRWEDYSKLTVAKEPYAANALAVARFDTARSLADIGTPTNRARWGMTPATVNAYYNPSNNEIVFPAGILGGVFFNPAADDAINYGAIGAVIGHEMTHGFDDQGRRFDANGNLRDWWTPADTAAFTTRAQCIVDQYSSYEPVAGSHIIGKQVQGEAIADLGGTTIAFKAFMKTPQYKANKLIDGFTPAQRFFLAYAQVWKSIATDDSRRQRASTDPHPDDKYRLIGTLSNMPEFRTAFKCAATDKMVRPSICQIW